MARRKPLQTSFSSGELAPDIIMRQDTEQYQNGAKSLLNRRCLIGGGTTRRPGSGREAELIQTGRAEPFIVNGVTKYILVFSAGRMDAFSQNANKTLAPAGSVVGAPWTGNIWAEMDYEQSANTAFLTHKSMPIQKLVRTGASSWSRADFVFFTVAAAQIEQPYYKIADPDVTLQPSALTGSITLTASAAHFIAAHVGKRIRIFRQECLITAFTDSTHVTATVIQKLRPTFRYQVLSSTSFAVGDEIIGSVSGIHAIVVNIPDGTHLDVVNKDSLDGFDGSDKLVGPNGQTTVTVPGTGITNAAVKDWDEQLFSSIWGYPSCVALHRNRLLFAGHPVIANALIGSKLDNLYSFDVGDQSDGDGIFETIGDAGASAIVQLHSAEQLIVLTDHGPYYVPEGQSAPFRPSSIAFFPFGSPWPITASAEPAGFDDGVLFVSGSLIIKARPTGNQNQLWTAGDDISLVASHLVKAPFRLAVTSNFIGRPERYAVMVNSDGTLAVMQLVESQKIRNLTPWATDGFYLSMAAIGGDLYFTTQRTINGQTRFFVEHFDQNLTLDCTRAYATLVDLNAGVPIDYGTTTVHVTVGVGDDAVYLGTWPLQQEEPPSGPYTAGLFYDSVIETLPPVIEDRDGSHTGEAMRITKVHVFVRGSHRFALDGNAIAAYQVTDDVGASPPVRNGAVEFEPTAGWVVDPTIIINQPDPLPLEVLAIKNVVNY
jgi:hypothetical protein